MLFPLKETLEIHIVSEFNHRQYLATPPRVAEMGPQTTLVSHNNEGLALLQGDVGFASILDYLNPQNSIS